MDGLLKEDLLDELQELKDEYEKITEEISLCNFQASKCKTVKELKAVDKELGFLSECLEENAKKMKSVLKQLEKFDK